MSTVRSGTSRGRRLRLSVYFIAIGINAAVFAMVLVSSRVSDLLVIGLWLMFASWIVLLMLQVWRVFYLQQAFPGERPSLFRWVGVGMAVGLLGGLVLELSMQDALWLCDDLFTGGATRPYCVPWQTIREWLPWIMGGLGATSGWILARGRPSAR